MIASGAIGTVFIEAEHAKLLAVNNGIPEEDIIVENKSKTTYENALYTKEILDSMRIYNHCLLISSAIHLRRARHTFEKAGIGIIEYPSDYETMFSSKDYVVSDYIFINLHAATKFQWLMKEIIGFTAYSITGKS